MPCRSEGFSSSCNRSRCNIGSKNASVLPLPVLEANATLLPDSSGGSASRCGKDGLLKPHLFTSTSASSGSTPRESHDLEEELVAGLGFAHKALASNGRMHGRHDGEKRRNNMSFGDAAGGRSSGRAGFGYLPHQV